jgi:hypothetical protein
MLVEMLRNSEHFKEYPKPQQEIFLILASQYEKSTEYLFLNPEELRETTQKGSRQHWTDFLADQTVQTYVKGQMAFLAQISQRKTFRSLVTSALEGNAQAAKQVQELSGIMSQVDSNKVVVLHHVPRPKQAN